MSDTVRFMTWNDTITTANSSGANGFPFPFVTGATGSETAYPVKVTFQDALKFWWGINNWSLSSTWSVTIAGTTYAFPSGPLVYGGPASELGLVSNIATLNFSVNTGNALAQLQINPSIISDDPTNNASDVWPNLQAPMFTAQLGASGAFVIFAFDSSLLSTVTGSFSATLAASAVTGMYSPPLFYDASAITGGNSYSVGDFVLTPSSFWAYAQLSDGLPIFDTSTGVTIAGRDPTN